MFEPGESVIFVNANNIAIFATFISANDGDHEGRVCVEYQGDYGDSYTCWPHLERVGKIGQQVARKMGQACCTANIL